MATARGYHAFHWSLSHWLNSPRGPSWSHVFHQFDHFKLSRLQRPLSTIVKASLFGNLRKRTRRLQKKRRKMRQRSKWGTAFRYLHALKWLHLEDCQKGYCNDCEAPRDQRWALLRSQAICWKSAQGHPVNKVKQGRGSESSLQDRISETNRPSDLERFWIHETSKWTHCVDVECRHSVSCASSCVFSCMTDFKSICKLEMLIAFAIMIQCSSPMPSKQHDLSSTDLAHEKGRQTGHDGYHWVSNFPMITAPDEKRCAVQWQVEMDDMKCADLVGSNQNLKLIQA